MYGICDDETISANATSTEIAISRRPHVALSSPFRPFLPVQPDRSRARREGLSHTLHIYVRYLASLLVIRKIQSG